MIVREPLPQFFLMPLFTQRRSENIFRAFEAWLVHVFERQIKILGTGLGIDRQTAVPGLANLLQSIVATEMDDVNPRTTPFCKRPRPLPRFGFSPRCARI